MNLCKDCKHFSEEFDASRAGECSSNVFPVIHLCTRRPPTIDPVLGDEVRNTSTCRSERAMPTAKCSDDRCGLEGWYWEPRC